MQESVREKLLVNIGPEFDRDVAERPARHAGAHAGRHNRSGPAGGRVVEIGSADTQRHAEDAGSVERRPAGVLPGHGDAAQRIHDARQKPRLRTLAEIPGILMQQAGQYSVAKEILGSEIAHRRAESLGVGSAAFAILGRLVVGLRKPGAQRLGGDVERIASLVQKELPFLLRRERRRRRGGIVDRLIVGDDAQDAVMVETCLLYTSRCV